MDETANLSLAYIMPQQAQKFVTHNDALRDLDTIVQLAVLDRDLAASPGSPTAGDRYLVAAGATGAWTGQDGAVAAFQDGGWLFYPPQKGWRIWIEDEAQLIAWTGSAWVLAGGKPINPADMLGVLATADTTNRLAVKSDAALFANDDITPGSGDMRIAVSKASAGKDASITLQDAGSARAVLGLLADDNFTLKTSPDGSTFHQALSIDKSTGHVGVGTTADSSNGIAVKGDAALFAYDDVTPGSGDMRISISKASSGKDAALTLQDAGSARAILGLLADDNFTIKTSPDGSTFYQALSLDKSTGHVGIGTTADGTNGLSVAGAANLFSNGAGSVRNTLSKHASTDTASFLFQDNFSGRAEFGLTGDDHFHLKVSPDGSTWKDVFYADETSAKLSIGAAAPTARLTVTDNAAAAPSPPSGTVLHAVSADSGSARVVIDAFGGAVAANLTFRHARGTATSPSAILSGDQLINVAGFGYGATGYSGTTRTGFVAAAAENWTDTAQGTYFGIFTTAVGSASGAERLRVDPSGNVGIGILSPARQLHVAADDATNAGVTEMLRVTHTTSGTPTVGIGVGIEFEVETATGNNKEIGMRVEAVATNVTGAAENFDFVLSLMSGGATASEAFRVKAAGTMSLPSGSFAANGSVATALSSLGPTGAHTTVQKWLAIDDAGTTRYLPCF